MTPYTDQLNVYQYVHSRVTSSEVFWAMDPIASYIVYHPGAYQ